ncbi:MucR family transcriptional regulator [Solidesulfovibrio sp. C21]|uniref:MucR family transcriptional regulator n=1 Tax=Solidesulfovibrio sp. C21 TaxID=3398613 RepID=UPI0039FD7137
MNEALQSAIEIVRAQASARPMTEDEITSMIKNVAAGIQAAAAGHTTGNGDGYEGMLPPAVDPKKAITESGVVCLECGKKFKILTKKHLASHGLTPESYREKYGYKKGTALACKSLVRERRKKMKGMKLWERRGKKAEGEKA